jgi:hypothetical protein
MAIVYTRSKVHWNFFTALEQDVETLARFVEPVQQNDKTYSLEMCRILFAAAAECEVVLKEIAKLFSCPSDRYDIKDLQRAIMQHMPDLAAEKVFIKRYGLELDPWKNWRSSQTPDWWTGYNKVKHQRLNNYDEGNLTNALNAVGALKIAVIFYYRKEFAGGGAIISFQDTLEQLSPESRLFFLADERYPSLLRIS